MGSPALAQCSLEDDRVQQDLEDFLHLRVWVGLSECQEWMCRKGAEREEDRRADRVHLEAFDMQLLKLYLLAVHRRHQPAQTFHSLVSPTLT
eukprot:scaffold99230_cov35-Tisochrysis_lutea.AAC.3